jgi:hypothetical protein
LGRREDPADAISVPLATTLPAGADLQVRPQRTNGHSNGHGVAAPYAPVHLMT